MASILSTPLEEVEGIGETTKGWLVDVVGIGATIGCYEGRSRNKGIGGLGANLPPWIRRFYALMAVSYASGRVAPPIVCNVVAISLFKALR